MAANEHPVFIQALQQAAAYGHPVTRIVLHETHISWVLLTGDYAYKIKKPVDFGFLDFSTLEKRRFFCAEELRVNARLAPDLYLDVVPICGSPDAPQMDGSGDAFEYAVKMRQFDTRQGFDELLARGELTREHMDQTAQVLADFHARIDHAAMESAYGTPQAIHQPVAENFQQIAPCVDQNPQPGQTHQPLRSLQAWSEKTFARLEPVFNARKQQGFVRECHGDLHLRNIILWQGQVTPFDGIEFNANLRWIDVISELAFLLMDLDDHQRPDLAQRLLNAYLEITGDYPGLALLPYYQAYRAMVRAKVACLRLLQTACKDDDSEQEMHNYIRLATSYTQPRTGKLIINHGLSGSGKTYVSQLLLEKTRLIRIRSDVERKRLFGLSAQQASGSGIDSGIYQATASQQTYAHLLSLTRPLLQQGYSVLVDAAFLKAQQRALFIDLAQQARIPFVILHCTSPPAILRQRLLARSQAGTDASEADLSILAHQLNSMESLSNAEQQHMLRVDTSTTPALEEVIAWLEA